MNLSGRQGAPSVGSFSEWANVVKKRESLVLDYYFETIKARESGVGL